MTRTIFAVSTLLALMTWCLAAPPEKPSRSQTGAAQVVYVGPANSAAWSGVLQGIKEANTLGQFTGVTFTLQALPLENLTARGRKRLPLAILSALDANQLQRLMSALGNANVLVFNLTASEDALRTKTWPRLLHIAPSSQMKAEAIAKWRAQHRDADTQALAWHPEFMKFGGRELNRRFVEGSHRPMTEECWTGWAAAKILAEATARTKSVQPARLLAYMRTELEFDGQKGVPQSFDEAGQMRQPLILVEKGQPVGEVEIAPAEPIRAEPPPRAYRAFVTNEKAGTLTVIDCRAQKVEATIQVGKRPRGIGLSPDRRTVYVALGDENAIAVVDARALKLLKKIPCGSDPENFAVHRNGRLYLSNEDANRMTILDPVSGKIVAEVPVGIEPEGVGISPDGTRVMVTSESTNMVHVISAPKHKVLTHILVAARPREVIFSKDGRYAYVTSEVGGKVSKLDVATNAIVREVRIEVPKAKPKGVLLSPDQQTLYVSTGRAGVVAVLDADSLTLKATISVGKQVWGLALSGDGSRLYTTNNVDNTLSIVDTATNKALATLSVGTGPWGVVTNDDPAAFSRGTFAGKSGAAEKSPADAAAGNGKFSPLAAIGWKLFFDPMLSRPKTFSCASCHNPAKGYGDGLALAKGPYGDVLTRRAPSIVNLQNAKSLFWDGRAKSLEEQAIVPLTSPIEMDMTVPEIVARATAEPHYRQAFAAVGVKEIGIEEIASALAAFERSLQTGQTAFDRWLRGDQAALDAAQNRGRMLFFTRGQCATCHSGRDLTDHDFHNTGLGTPNDQGRYRITGKRTDIGKFKTPSLRNWKGRGPFMHDGRLATIREVIDYYVEAPKAAVGESELDPLPLTEKEKEELSAFLETLNGAWPDMTAYASAWQLLLNPPKGAGIDLETRP